ncbi:MAG: P-loop NTPase fold protein [Candidatus Angelobacter sp.]
MNAPANPKSSSSPAATSSARNRLYLRPRTKVWALALCFVLMIGASVWAVLQPVRPDPMDSSWRASILYPHETNPYARLQAISCANEYACRLNSVALNGTGDSPEVWAVGNVGLVLHRAAGQRKWEQLTINAVEESTSPEPSSSPTPRSTPDKKAAAARPPATATPTATPNQQSPVPYLLGLSEAEARKIAESQGFLVSVEDANDNQPNQSAQSKMPNQSAQQSAPPRQVVVKQSPEPKTLAPRKSTITIMLGRAPSKASFLDKLLPTVYAAEPEKGQPSKTAQHGLSADQRNQALNAADARHTATHEADTIRLDGKISKTVSFSPLDDDLLHISCFKGQCFALGRSGAVFTVISARQWTYKLTRFSGLPGSSNAAPRVLLFSDDAGTLYVKQDSAVFRCTPSKPSMDSYTCDAKPASSIKLEFGPEGSPVTVSADGRIESMDGSLSAADMVNPLSQEDHIWPPVAKLIPSVRSIAVDSQNKVFFFAGDEGTIVSIQDGVITGHYESIKFRGNAPNHKLPALWYWALAAMLMVVSSVVVAIPGEPAAAEVSVADWAVTDAPLKPGDIDSLNFTPMALGLSRFIRNPKTQPPVTIAIEGEWGEGKSSVMSLLEGDLKKSRYCPVWFNAWHHQSEEQLLAALLEHIKDQAIPPWWHIDNWIFRARLLRSRMGRKWPVLVILAIVFASTAAFEISRDHLDEFIQSPTSLIPFKNYIPGLSDDKQKPADSAAGAQSASTASTGPKSSDAKPPDSKPVQETDLRHLGLIASFFGLLGAIFKIAKAFGIDSSKLTDNLRDATTIKDVKPDPGIRRQFAREFGDFCEAWSWGGRRVIIFIDDLDRCRPESVVTVLESINFLTTAGDCMIVLGMAQKQVTHAVGLSFKDIAQSQQAYLDGCNTEQEKAIARFKYGELYIKKLVNIVAHLPKTTSEQRRKVLESRAAEARRQDEQVKAAALTGWRTGLWEWLSESGRMAVKFAPVMAMLLAIVISMLLGYQKGAAPAPPQAQVGGANTSSTQESSLINDVKKQSNAPVSTKSGEAKPLVYDRPTAQQAKLKDPEGFTGGSWWSYSISALLLVIFFGLFGYQLSARTNQDAQNSPEFEKSLELWGEYIVGLCDTPREIKRALNDLRYQAMTRRMNGPSSTRGERLTKALRQLVTGRKEKDPVEARVDEAALPPLKAAALASLSADEETRFLSKDAETTYPGITETMKMLLGMKAKHIEIFGRWIGAPAPEPPDPSGDLAHAHSA